MACLFCFVLYLLDTLTRSHDRIPHQSYPLILIGLECFCEFSRISFNGFVLHSVIVAIGLPYQKHFFPTSTVKACSSTHSRRRSASAHRPPRPVMRRSPRQPCVCHPQFSARWRSRPSWRTRPREFARPWCFAGRQPVPL